MPYSLFQMKIPISITKLSHQDRGPCYLHLPVFFVLRLVSAIFVKMVFFTKWYSVKNYEKCFLFHPKSSFHSWDIQIFVFLSFPLFLPVGHCFRGWSKINLKVYDILNRLNKNSVTHFAWYLEKEKKYDIETLSIDGISDKKYFYRKIMQEMFSKSYSQTSL